MQQPLPFDRGEGKKKQKNSERTTKEVPLFRTGRCVINVISTEDNNNMTVRM